MSWLRWISGAPPVTLDQWDPGMPHRISMIYDTDANGKLESVTFMFSDWKEDA